MVVSKSHFDSLASMGSHALEEYERLSRTLRNSPFLRDGIPLEAEHGSAGDQKAGACVVHTHVHWLPSMGHYFDNFRQRLSQGPESTLGELWVSRAPYIFVRAGSEHAIFQADGLRSQTIRRILCELMDRDDLDWTQAPRLDWVEETVAAWEDDRHNL